jgi:hypothetical protein
VHQIPLSAVSGRPHANVIVTRNHNPHQLLRFFFQIFALVSSTIHMGPVKQRIRSTGEASVRRCPLSSTSQLRLRRTIPSALIRQRPAAPCHRPPSEMAVASTSAPLSLPPTTLTWGAAHPFTVLRHWARVAVASRRVDPNLNPLEFELPDRSLPRLFVSILK